MWRMSLLEIQHVDYKEERREIKGEWLPSLPSCLLLSSSLKCLLSKFRKHWLKSLRSQVGDVHVRRRYHMIGSGVVCGKWYIPEKFSYPLFPLFLKNNFLNLFMHLATQCGPQDFSSPTRYWSHVHCRPPPNHRVGPSSSCFLSLWYWWSKPVCKMLKFKDKHQNCFSGIGNCLTPLFRSKWKSLSFVLLFATPWTVQSIKFSRPEYRSG